MIYCLNLEKYCDTNVWQYKCAHPSLLCAFFQTDSVLQQFRAILTLKMWPLKMYLDNKCNLSNGRSACEDALLLQVSSKVHQSKISPEMSYMIDENNERQLSWPFVFCAIQIYCMTMEKYLDTRPSRKYVNATCMMEWENYVDLKKKKEKHSLTPKCCVSTVGFLDKMFNSCVDFAISFPCTPLSYLTCCLPGMWFFSAPWAGRCLYHCFHIFVWCSALGTV